MFESNKALIELKEIQLEAIYEGLHLPTLWFNLVFAFLGELGHLNNLVLYKKVTVDIS